MRFDYIETRQKPQEEEWPPHQPNSIVSVALIHYKTRRTELELIEISTRFKEGAPFIDKLVSTDPKVTKNIQNIFEADPLVDHTTTHSSSSKLPKRILIEGAPGIGKTILAKEITYFWAQGELLKECKLTFLIFLRDPRVHTIKSVKDLLQLFTSDELAQDLEKDIEESKGKNIAFVFDGFDEYSPSLQKDSLVTDIIKGYKFSKSTVVITSRPTATLFLHDLVDRKIEILGFSTEERDRYITLSLLGAPDNKREKLDKHLQKYPIINSLCFVPLHLAILLFLLQMDSLPETLTEMNEYFIVHTVYRHLNKLDPYDEHEIKRLADLPKNIYQVIRKLSALAFTGLKKNQLVFSYDEMNNVCPEICNTTGDIYGYGLLQAVRHYVHRGAGRTISFNFLHFTMQEYLAALHVSTLTVFKQSELMEKTFWDGQYNFMWMMYVGILGIRSHVLNFFSKYISRDELQESKISDDENDTDTMDSDYFMAFNDEHHDISNITNKCNAFISANEFDVVNTTELKVNTDNLSASNIIDSLDNADTGNENNVNTNDGNNLLTLDNSLGVDDAIMDYGVTTYMHSDHANDVSTEESSDDIIEAENFFDTKYDNSMSEVELKLSFTIPDRLPLLRQDLESDKRKYLHIFQCFIEAKRNHSIPQSISSMVKDGVVALSNITLLPHHISSLVFFMSASTSQKWKALELGKCNLRSIGMNTLLEHIAKNEINTSTLEYVDLSDNEASPWAVYCAFIKNCCVHSLTVCGDNGIETYIEQLTDCLESNTMLTSLTLCGIGRNGIESIKKVLVKNTTLFEVNVSQRKIRSNSDDKPVVLLYTEFMNKARTDNHKVKINIWWDSYHEWPPYTIHLYSSNINDTSAVFIAFGLYFNTTVQTLDISHNLINDDGAVAIGKSLKFNKTLHNLKISHNSINDDGAVTIGKSLKINKTLQILIISNNEIKDAGASSIFINAIENSSLKLLDISNNQISDEGATAIAECLKYNNTLQNLNISYNKINNDGIVKIVNAMNKNTTLQKIDISYNELSDCEAISDCLKINSTLLELTVSMPKGLKHLWVAMITLNRRDEIIDVSGNKIGDSEELVALVLAMLHNNTITRKLDISWNRLSDSGVVAIDDCLKHNNDLWEINISHNNITDKGAAIIAQTIRFNTAIKLLNISHNNISNNGALAISQCLKCNKSLEELDLSHSAITSKGAVMVINAITVSKALRKLNISQIKFVKDGILSISDALKSNSTLLTLVISFPWSNIPLTINVESSVCNMANKMIGNIETSVIMAMLHKNTVVKKLDISSNKITNDGIISISHCLKENTTLQEINVSMNSISNIGAVKISEAIENNFDLLKLDISNCLQNDSIKIICSRIPKNTTLQELNMSFNSIDTIEIARCIAELIQTTNALKKLDISHCSIPDGGALIISESYKSSKTLQELIISWKNDQITINTKSLFFILPGKHIGDTGTVIISNLLYRNTIINILEISHNHICGDGIITIGNCLKNYNAAQELNVSGNFIGIQGATKIGELIEVNLYILKLRISMCGMKDDCIIIICDSITRQRNATLQELIMSCNTISNKGAKKIAELIKINTTLKTLDISYCNIPDEGAIAISDAYKYSETLQELKLSWKNDTITISTVELFYKLSYKSIDDTDAVIISNILYKNTNTKIVDISYNNISDDGALAICNCLRNNSTLEELIVSGNSITSKGVFFDSAQIFSTLKIIS